jgi:Mn-dependent DtxR family transcriptional regulator
MTDIYVQDNGKKRKATTAELKQFETDHAEYEAEQKRIEAELKVKEAARQSAMAKLKALGLTDDEISALVP